MSIISEKNVYLLFAGLIAAGILLFFSILVMHFLMPKAVLERFWKQPHFRAAEIALFTSTIYAPMRTVMLMGAIAFPRWGKKRGVTDVRLFAPRWYRSAAIILCSSIIVIFTGILTILIGTSIDAYISGERALWPGQKEAPFEWKQTMADAAIVFCVVFVLVKIFWRAEKKSRTREDR